MKQPSHGIVRNSFPAGPGQPSSALAQPSSADGAAPSSTPRALACPESCPPAEPLHSAPLAAASGPRAGTGPRAPAPAAASPRRPPPTSLPQPRGAEPTPPSPLRSGVGAALTARVGPLGGKTILPHAGVCVCSARSELQLLRRPSAAGRGRVLACSLGSAVPRRLRSLDVQPPGSGFREPITRRLQPRAGLETGGPRCILEASEPRSTEELHGSRRGLSAAFCSSDL